MRVLIVGKTQMWENACVGAISLQNGRSLRLLTGNGGHQPRDTDFEIGEVWDIEGNFPPADSLEPPHTEDFYVRRKSYVQEHPNVTQYILDNIAIAHGGPSALFGGALQYTQKRRGYISRHGPIPQYSTGFWQSERPLRLNIEDGKNYYLYSSASSVVSIPYVGFADTLAEIPANALVRVSLARWWKPKDADDSLEPRCYLQFSGWFN